eukprot:CAMPEP_0172822456 /NCGR_PEP_ID=MMETSP1075-20121228/16684_1 /TAXON_ID=2916 /ORGANISM="Ceratium fusus, Strain PA161109" /LENGTH=78 /DNA_ID=CAMNT_0013663447 /DNA_START=62 /DNA_END=298 /DNA_ORIENTATION=+
MHNVTEFEEFKAKPLATECPQAHPQCGSRQMVGILHGGVLNFIAAANAIVATAARAFAGDAEALDELSLCKAHSHEGS